jgi:hypothetical protein
MSPSRTNHLTGLAASQAAPLAMIVPGFVLKMRQPLTFSATIGGDVNHHEDDGGHNDFGAAHDIRSSHLGSDSDQGRASGANHELKSLWGTTTMLSVDQFLRLISVPAVVAAFLIASQVSGAGIFRSTASQYATSE